MTLEPESSGQFMTVGEMLAETRESYRHSRPISLQEVTSMIEYVCETKAYSPKLNTDWVYVTDTPTFNYIKRFHDSSGLVRSRLWVKIPNIPPQAVFYCLFDSERRMSFDKYYKRFEISKVISDSLDVLVSEIEAPMGVRNREFVEWRRCLLPDITSAFGKKAVQYAIYLRSCGESECSTEIRPNCRKTKIERAEVWMSGYVIQWWIDEKSNALLGSEVMVMSQIDNKGMIPKFVLNSMSSTAPKKWAASLIDAVSTICVQFGVDIATMSNDAELEQIFGIRANKRLLEQSN